MENLITIQSEIEKSIIYIKGRGDEITTGEVMQEIGNLKLLVDNLIEKTK